jgi:hypothetical protein
MVDFLIFCLNDEYDLLKSLIYTHVIDMLVPSKLFIYYASTSSALKSIILKCHSFRKYIKIDSFR